MIIYATSLLPNPFTPSRRLTLALIYYSGYVVLLQESRVPLEPLTLTRVPLVLVTLLFQRLRHYQNVQYLLLVQEIRLYLCMLCHTYRTPCGTSRQEQRMRHGYYMGRT